MGLLEVFAVEDPEADSALFESLVSIYSEAFSGPPWNEQWTLESSRAALREIFCSKEFDLAVSKYGGAITGFGIGMPLAKTYDPEWFAELGFNPSSSYYIADLATDFRYRSMGSCRAYTSSLVSAAIRRGYESVVVRTIAGNTPVLRTVERLGFKLSVVKPVLFEGVVTPRVVYSLTLR